MLFLLYVNDLPSISSEFLSILYADDTMLLSSNSDHSRLIQLIYNKLPKIQQWTASNRLSVILDKTFAMVFINREKAITNNGEIYFDCSRIKYKTQENFLRLIIDNQCKFGNHVGYIW